MYKSLLVLIFVVAVVQAETTSVGKTIGDDNQAIKFVVAADPPREGKGGGGGEINPKKPKSVPAIGGDNQAIKFVAAADPPREGKGGNGGEINPPNLSVPATGSPSSPATQAHVSILVMAILAILLALFQ